MSEKYIAKLIFGDDDYLVDRRASFIFESIDCSDHSGEIYRCDVQNTDDFLKIYHKVYDAINTVSLFSGDKIVWLRGLNCFSDVPYAKTELAKDYINRLLDLISKACCTNILVSLAKPDKRLKLFKDLCFISDSEEVKSEEKSTISTKTIIELCKENNVVIHQDAIELFKAKIGKDARLASNEIEKLATFIKTGDYISVADVKNLVADSNPGEFFDQIEIFYGANRVDLIESIEKYFWFNSEGRPLLYALQARNRLLIQLRSLIDDRILRQRISADDLGHAKEMCGFLSDTKSGYNIFSQNPWYLSNLAQQAVKFSIEKLMTFQKDLYAAFIDLSVHYDDQCNVVKSLALKWLTCNDEKF